MAKNFEKQLTNSRRLRSQCDFADSKEESPGRAEALRTSLLDAEQKANARLDTWTVSRLLFIVEFSLFPWCLLKTTATHIHKGSGDETYSWEAHGG